MLIYFWRQIEFYLNLYIIMPELRVLNPNLCAITHEYT